ncbi:ATPase family AAA domain-containing protein 2-like isoform X2 [Boleophthalmus pectinirostris]|uniref:ATPase family AAA domain-containing protein 2-like isoform X2 n=1 Tax=Boleophthalmus pectinirostris TaxID=150288 RepID=UPI00242FEFF5|nr:ATPase family AAA domain-containing protein 2-like isoform X2 [Boleophthalmus pectinirostris]
MVMVGTKPQSRPGKGVSSPAKTQTNARGMDASSGLEPEANGTESDDEMSYSESEDHEELKVQASVIRKSLRIQNAKLKGLRRSSRITNRNQTSNMFDGLSTNTVRSVLKTVNEMKNKKRLATSREGKIYSKAQRSMTPLPPQLSDTEQVNEPVKDQDSDCGQSVDAKTSRASSLYNAGGNDLFRGTFRISASGPNIPRRGSFRPTPSPWVNKADSGEDSDDSDIHSAMARCRPLNLNLLGTRRDKLSSGAGLADIDPMAIDQTVGFDSIGGLSGHISALKEMVVFPLLYPEVFDNFKIQPPRGCLFYGPPGTGKTLVARALASECSQGSRKVAFFMRKGADVLSKWVGESERQLRLLFEQAYQMRPSIIFFDEIDGLAPVRSSRQDQIHSSIVSTLLALMDGLDNRGEVVVIGATNRLDSIDPALRRPGRFDREFLFGLPDREARAEILKIHTRQWRPAPSDDFLQELAEKCVGYCGADIRAVCTEAALCALRRRYPQIYGTSQKLLLDVRSITVTSTDFVNAMKSMSPSAHRSNPSPAKPLTATVLPLLSAALQGALQRVQRLFPHAEQAKRKREPALTAGLHDDGVMPGGDESGTSISASGKTRKFLHFARSAVRQPTSHRPRLLLVGRPGSGESSHLGPALLHALESFTVYSLETAAIYGVSSTTPEEACTQVFREAQRTSPSVLYLPHLQQWWETAGGALRSSFLTLLSGIPSFAPVLLLATTCTAYSELDPEVKALFREEYGELFFLPAPSVTARTEFFSDLILRQATEAPPSNNSSLSRPLEILPLAPPPPPRQLSEQERHHLEEQEEDVLRELRLFLRNITERLSLDRRFNAFTKPVAIEEVPDYLMVIKQPMDLSTLLTNIDKHKYITVSEFVTDADLIWKNALDYNPDSDSIDRHIRHRAYALKDTLHAIIRDDLDHDFERVCQEVKESRMRRAAALDYDIEDVHLRTLKRKRYRRKSKWSTGVIPKPKKKKAPVAPPTASSESYSSLSSLSECSENGHAPNAQLNGFERRSDHLTNGFHRTIVPPTAAPHLSAGRGERQKKLADKVVNEQMKLLNKRENGRKTSTEPLVIDRSKLKDLLQRAVVKTEGAEVEPLEKLYTVLAQSIYRHRDNANKSDLIKEMKREIESFS